MQCKQDSSADAAVSDARPEVDEKDVYSTAEEAYGMLEEGFPQMPEGHDKILRMIPSIGYAVKYKSLAEEQVYC